MRRKVLVVVLLAVAVFIAIVPLIMISDSEFGGADGKAEGIVEEISPEYRPWAESPIVPPGAETESLLFSLQAALGAGVIGAGFGYLAAKNKYQKEQ